MSAEDSSGVGGQGPLRVGRVSRVHGLRGELEVRPDWAESSSLLEAPSVILTLADGASRQHVVRGARQTPKGVLLALEGISDRTTAEAVRGAEVSIPRAALPALEVDEYYLSDLVGFSVEGPDGAVGVVVGVQIYPSVDAVVVELLSGEHAEQPLLDEWLDRVDVPGRRLVLRGCDGLIEAPKRRPS